MVLVDTEAGTEHFGRGVEANVDSVLIVTEPSFDSLELTEKIGDLAREIGVKSTWAILNKVPSEEIAGRLSEELKRRGISIIGSIRYDPEVFQAGLEGRPACDDTLESDIARILDHLL